MGFPPGPTGNLSPGADRADPGFSGSLQRSVAPHGARESGENPELTRSGERDRIGTRPLGILGRRRGGRNSSPKTCRLLSIAPRPGPNGKSPMRRLIVSTATGCVAAAAGVQTVRPSCPRSRPVRGQEPGSRPIGPGQTDLRRADSTESPRHVGQGPDALTAPGAGASSLHRGGRLGLRPPRKRASWLRPEGIPLRTPGGRAVGGTRCAVGVRSRSSRGSRPLRPRQIPGWRMEPSRWPGRSPSSR